MARKSISDFTDAEKDTINALHARDFANMTKDEILLFAEWESTNALIESEIAIKEKEARELTQARIDSMKRIEHESLATLEALANEAKEHYKAVQDGKA